MRLEECEPEVVTGQHLQPKELQKKPLKHTESEEKMKSKEYQGKKYNTIGDKGANRGVQDGETIQKQMAKTGSGVHPATQILSPFL